MSEFKKGALVMCMDGAPNLAHRKFAGTIHQLGEVVCRDYLGEHWRLVPPTVIGNANLQWTRRYLRLIDDPPEDATDETLHWLPVPTKEEA